MQGGTKQELAESWLREDTVNAWRHQRMYQLLDPILAADSGSSWLTVGDGRYGNDARYISGRQCLATASDISDTLLKVAHERGYINHYRVENAEHLSMGDDEYDYVFCKEAYHHFPRPSIALYEMLRVARKAAVLIEPNDSYIANSVGEILFRNGIDFVKRLLGRPISLHSFENTGNYVYSISRREIEKMAIGLNYRFVAFKGINDAFRQGAEKELIAKKGKIFRQIFINILLLDILARLRIRDYRLLSAVIFKESPSKVMREELVSAGYRVVDLPENPYIS